MARLVDLTCLICVIYRNAFADSSPSTFIFTTDDSIFWIDLLTNNVTKITDQSYPYNVDYQYELGYMYWTGGFGFLYRLNLSSAKNTPELLNTPPDHYALGVAVDYINNHLFWTDRNNGLLIKSELDASNKTILLNSGLISPRDIKLDLENQDIYVGDFEAAKIDRCKLDGSERETIIKDTTLILSIALDIVGKRIFWTNYNNNMLSAKMDGSDVRTIREINVMYFGMVVSEDFIYFSEWDLNNFVRINKNTGNNFTILYSDTKRIRGIFTLKNNALKCSPHNNILNAEKKSTGFVLQSKDAELNNDEKLQEGWYRIMSKNGDKMATTPPGPMHCGTNNPIWLNGSLPSVEDGNVTRMACMQSHTDICQEILEIKVQNCGSFYVYFLQNTPPNSSYCFGEGSVLCEDGTSSETGYYPGCSSSYPNDEVNVTVLAELIEGETYPIPNVPPAPSLVPVFKCGFDYKPINTYVFDVYWYIDEQHIKTHLNVSSDELPTTLLQSNDWTSTHRMNMKVKCALRLRYHIGSVPSPFHYSPDFDAGIFPEKSEYTVIEGKHIDIQFTPTVPVGCLSSDKNFRSHCAQSVFVFQPKDVNDGMCRNNIASRDIVFEAKFCGIEIGSADWNTSKPLRVYGYSDGMYNFKDRSTYVRLSTSSVLPLNELWKNLQVPDIKVTVVDKDSVLINRLCQSSNDPHIRTYDGKYYHYMEIGEFVMYKNDIGPYWVHALFTNCGFGWSGSACHCGIAVRSRNSLFVLRTCESISRHEKHLLDQPITELISCDDDIQVENTGNSYKITLPIGTEIQFTVSRWSKFISSITIKPSIFDIDETKGLCGVPNLSKDPSDDYYHRTRGPITDDQLFGDSWKVTSFSEQLFIEEPEFLTNEYVTNIDIQQNINNSSTYCVCEKEGGSSDSLDEFNTVQCNLTASTEYCSEEMSSDQNTITVLYPQCTKSRRRKRSADTRHTIVRRSIIDDDDDFEYKPLIYDDDITELNREVQQNYTNDWTDTKARQTCSESINKAIPSELYSDLMDINEEFFIESCMKDIKLVGDTVFISDTIGAKFGLIKTELSRNESLYIETTSDGSQTLLDYISSFLCPNNCSGNGNCTRGICVCFDGYVGDDCSQSKSTPLSNITASFSGLCTLGTRKCEKINIYGDFLSNKVWCRINHFEILKHSHRNISADAVSMATFRNMFMVSVTLPVDRRRKRSVSQSTQADGYDISLSHDGIHFGNSVTVIVYDENCYSCNSTDKTCTDLNVCSQEETQSTDEDKSGIIIAAVVSSVCVVIVGLSVFIFYKIKSTKPKKLVDTSSSNHGLENEQETKPSVNTWMTKEITFGELNLDIGEIRPRTPVELFQIHQAYMPKAKPKFDISDLKTSNLIH